MTTHRLDGLSGLEFERLVRGLLDAEHGRHYTPSAPGPDDGVDLHHVGPEGSTVVQCKHFLGSGVRTLLSRLRREERPKVERLAPDRYLLVTSLPLTAAVKREIVAVFAPYCRGDADVLGAQDIDALLERHPAVADRNVKLWLTSEPALRRVLHADLFDDSALDLDRARRIMSRVVVPPALDRAQAILDEHHVCVIAGLPGIGKTTLARLLLLRHEAREFQIVRVGSDLARATAAVRRGSRAIFHFDDFLGQTVLEPPERNEYRRLAEFMESVRHEPGWRFVLTSREYLLHEAQLRSEALARLALDYRTCTISLDADYTPSARARILYQHLFFSDLPADYLTHALAMGAVARVAGHPNFSPRLVELLTSRSHTAARTPPAYAEELVETFDRPSRLWEVAFRAMAPSVRDLALVMASLPDAVALPDLHAAYDAFRAARMRRLNGPRESDEFTEALRVLDGTILRTNARALGAAPRIVVAFHNPSIRDYLRSRLASHADDLPDLIASCIYFEQLRTLFSANGQRPFPAILGAPDSFVAAVRRLIVQRAPHLPDGLDPVSALAGVIRPHRESAESRAFFAYELARALGTDAAWALQAELFADLRARVARGENVEAVHAAVLVRQVYGRDARPITADGRLAEGLADALLAAAREAASEDDVETVAELLVSHVPALATSGRLTAARDLLRDVADALLSSDFWPESADLYDGIAASLARSATLLGVDDLDHATEEFYARGLAQEEREHQRAAEERAQRGGWQQAPAPPEVPSASDAPAELFARLAAELASRVQDGGGEAPPAP